MSTKVRPVSSLSDDEKKMLEEARKKARRYRSHYDCIDGYLRYLALQASLGVRKMGAAPSIHEIQQKTQIGCWRTVRRCVDKWIEQNGDGLGINLGLTKPLNKGR